MTTDVERALDWWIKQEELFELEPMPHREKRLRSMYLSSELYQGISNPPPDDTERFARLEADLATFVTSPTIDPGYLKGLWPRRDGIWAIRSVRPSPSIRVLGLFAEKDRFVATNYAVRSELGGFESKQWREAKRRAGVIWRRLFPTYPFNSSREVNDLFTGAINGNYCKR
jgi:hypothetical protein